MNRDPGKRRLCVLCKHFDFSGGSPGYSELTPGDSGDMSCDKKVWPRGMDYLDTQGYRTRMLTAVSCEWFELADDLKHNNKEQGK